MRLLHNSTEEGLSIRQKILLSASTLAATLLLFSVPYPLSLETVWVIPVCVSTILSLWLALTSRFLAAFALACLGGILYAFSLQAFEVHYLYQFPLKDGRMFRSGAYYAYSSILRNREWAPLMTAAIGIAFLAALSVVTLSGRFHHRSPAPVDGLRKAFVHALSVTVAVGALIGLFVGWSRIHFGFIVGIQGLILGLALGLIARRFLPRGSPDNWTSQRRELLLAAGLCSLLFFELIGIGASQGSFAPHRWLANLLSGDYSESLVGFTRYRWNILLFRPGPLAWVLFNLLDIVFMLFLAMVTLCNRAGSLHPKHAGDKG